MSAQLALLLSSFLIVLAPTAGPKFRELIRSPYYLWVIAGFGLPGLLRVVGLGGVSDSDATELDAFIRYAPMLAIGAVIGFRNVTRGRIYPAHLLLLLVVLMPVVFAVGEFSPMPLVAAIAFLPALAADRNHFDLRALTLGLAHSLKPMALALIAYGFSGSILGLCRLDKCSVWGQQIGSIGTGNALGLLIAVLAFASIQTARSWRWSVVVTLATLVLVDLCSSRSGVLTWVFAAGVAWALRLSASASMRTRVKLMITAAASAVLAAGGVAITTWEPSAFTLRGVLWLRAQDLFSQNPLLGFGSSFWVRQPWTNALIANYSTHNVVLELLVSMGLIGFTALTLSIVLLVKRSVGDAKLLGLALAGLWIASGIAEVLSAPGRLYLVPALLPLVFVALNGLPEGGHPDGLDEHDRDQLALSKRNQRIVSRARASHDR